MSSQISCASKEVVPDLSAIERNNQLLIIEELELSPSFKQSALRLTPPEPRLEALCRTTIADICTDIRKVYPTAFQSARDSYLLSVAVDKLDRVGLAEFSQSLGFLLERCIKSNAAHASSEEENAALREFSQYEMSRIDFSKRLLLGTQPSTYGRLDLYRESVWMMTAFLSRALESSAHFIDTLHESFSAITQEPQPAQKRSWLPWVRKAA